ncbi:MAG: terminase family protein [Sphingomicrobium sp.]
MDLRTLLTVLAKAPPAMQKRVLDRVSAADIRALGEDWFTHALRGQYEPPGDWRVWLMMAGRGFGKTRGGAEWVLARARAEPGARIALIGASIADAVRVMIEGDSGLMTSAWTTEKLVWRRSSRELRFPSGATAFIYSGANPNDLRGPQHHFAWADEIAKWRKPDAAWDNLEMGMRLGERPRIVVTTTPGGASVVARIRDLIDSEWSGGRTYDNPYLPAAFIAAMRANYAGTRLARQELDGELLGEAEGALWTRETIERRRVAAVAAGDARLQRVVVGVDPPASATGDKCGIVVCALDAAGVGLVLADCSIGGQRPEGWARVVAAAAEGWHADRVIAEANNGGDMVDSVLRTVAPGLPVKLVHASRGKAARAEPVAAAFEAGRCAFAGSFPELEDELSAIASGGYAGPGSPDRADAMVWALTALVVKAPPAIPRIRRM